MDNFNKILNKYNIKNYINFKITNIKLKLVYLIVKAYHYNYILKVILWP